jgi:hypothetical protein
MLKAVSQINKQIHSLAAVINSPTLTGIVTAQSSSPHVPVHVMVKKHSGALYLFAVSLYQEPTEATFQVEGLGDESVAEVLDDGRTIPVRNGQFTDQFEGYDVRLFRIR